MNLYEDLNFGKKKRPLKKVILVVFVLLVSLSLLARPTVDLTFYTVNFLNDFTQKFSQNLKTGIKKIINKDKLIDSQSLKIKELKKQLRYQKYQLQFFQANQNNYKKQYQIRKLKSEKFPRSIEAEVISRSPNLWNQEIIINKGKIEKIKPGNVAITTKGVVGQVSKVHKNFSIVELVSSRRVKFGASVKRTGVLGVIFGDRPGYANLKFVPIGSDIKTGDLIETTRTNPGKIDNLFPIFYPVGTVTKVQKDSNSSELKIEVKLSEDGSDLTNLLVVKPFRLSY